MAGSHEPKVEVDYNLVLADMKARHAALGQSIASMEAWLKGGGAPLSEPGRPGDIATHQLARNLARPPRRERKR